MKVPLSWLKEFVDIQLPVKDLAHRITMAGLEVSGIRYIGVEGAELPWDRERVLVANVLEVKPHPNADALVLADVDYGADQPHTVVTGAPNLFPYKGKGRLDHPLKAVFAKEGAKLYDGHKEGWVVTTLKGRPVRGVMSDAMLCSEKELGMSEAHEGIIFLDDDMPVGAPLCDVLGDVVLDIDITPNLARCLSIVGIAREVAAITNSFLRIPELHVQMDGPPVEERIRVTIEEPDLCPRFTAALVENITIKPSPYWMQRRLTYAGMRPINNIVDISNYVMLEWGEPTHAFDADKVQNQHLIVRLAKPGEELTTLDGKERKLDPEDPSQMPPLVVCDETGALALAGVMGGESSEVSESSKRILLEAAIWEPSQIRRTARRYKIPSEASYRFERGVDVELSTQAQLRALELMRTLADGTVSQGMVDVYPQPWETINLELTPAEITRIVGIRLTSYDLAEILMSLGFKCRVKGDPCMGDLAGFTTGIDEHVVNVYVPSSRRDVTCTADLCEEIARIYGYERIPTTRMRDELPHADSHPEVMLEQQVRTLMTGCNADEVITYSMTNMESVAKLTPSEAEASRYIKLSNAISPEREYLQRSMLPSLLEALVTNVRERERAVIFELGRVFLPREGIVPASDEDWLPEEQRHLALAMAGKRDKLTWSGSASTQQELDFFDLKGIVETLMIHVHLYDKLVLEPLTNDERFHPGRAATLLLEQVVEDAAPASKKERKKKKGKQETKRIPFGVIGELHPDVCERFESPLERLVAAEINLDILFAQAQPATYNTISRYPATVQDLAIVADLQIPSEEIAKHIRRGAGDLLESLNLFDVYTGPQVGENKRSLAYRLSFRTQDRTLSDESLAKVRTKIAKVLEREVGATLRA